MDKKRNQNKKKEINVSKPQWLILGGLLLVALIIGITAFVLSDQSILDRESQIEKLSQSPRNYYGDEVSLTGNVSSVIGSRALTIEGPGIISDEVLVISKKPVVPVGGGIDEVLYSEGMRVSIAGEARSFSIAEMERELGVDLVDEQFQHWEGQPVVIADSIQEDL